jgi:acetyl-CoA C-acetyltransferase
MSNCPYYVKDARFGARLGNRVLEDGLVSDGLMEPGGVCHMGMHAELCAKTHDLSRAYVGKAAVVCPSDEAPR